MYVTVCPTLACTTPMGASLAATTMKPESRFALSPWAKNMPQSTKQLMYNGTTSAFMTKCILNKEGPVTPATRLPSPSQDPNPTCLVSSFVLY